MNFSPSYDFGDRRIAQQQDEEKNRLIAIANIKRDEAVAQAKWAEKQREEYTGALVVNNIPSLQDVLISENDKAVNDQSTNYALAEKHLLSIANKDTVNYILDRLEEVEIFALNQQWDLVVSKLKKEYTKTGLNKNVFISLIKNISENFIDKNNDYENNLSEKGFGRLTEEQKRAQEIQKELDAKKKEDDDRDKLMAELNKATANKRKEKKKNRNPQPLPPPLTPPPKTAPEPTTSSTETVQTGYLPPTPKKTLSELNDMRKPAIKAFLIRLTGDPRSAKGADGKELKVEELKRKIIDYQDGNITSSDMFGLGLKKTPKKQRVIIGGNLQSQKQKFNRTVGENKKVINGKYIDLEKLKQNIISVRYVSTGAYLPSLKVQTITDETKEIINDILGNKYDARLYKKLNPDERRIIKRLKTILKLNIDVGDEDDLEFSKNYKILLGEFQAGNNNPEIIAKLRKYVVEAISQNIIPRNFGFNLLVQLSI